MSVVESQKDTLRKRLVRAVVSERRAILLDELRWIVLQREAKGRGNKLEVITSSALNSFARTVREYMREVETHDLDINDESRCSADVIAAMAVFRLRERAKLDFFLSGESPLVEWRYVTDLPVHEFGESARYYPGFAIPYYHLHLVDLSVVSRTGHRQRVERIKIPPSHKVTVVSEKRAWSTADLHVERAWEVIQS